MKKAFGACKALGWALAATLRGTAGFSVDWPAGAGDSSALSRAGHGMQSEGWPGPVALSVPPPRLAPLGFPSERACPSGLPRPWWLFLQGRRNENTFSLLLVEVKIPVWGPHSRPRGVALEGCSCPVKPWVWDRRGDPLALPGTPGARAAYGAGAWGLRQSHWEPSRAWGRSSGRWQGSPCVWLKRARGADPILASLLVVPFPACRRARASSGPGPSTHVCPPGPPSTAKPPRVSVSERSQDRLCTHVPLAFRVAARRSLHGAPDPHSVTCVTGSEQKGRTRNQAGFAGTSSEGREVHSRPLPIPPLALMGSCSALGLSSADRVRVCPRREPCQAGSPGPALCSVLNGGLVGLLVDPRICECNLIWRKGVYRCN